MVLLRLLPTPPHDDAVAVEYGPENVCPVGTFTLLFKCAYERTGSRFHAANRSDHGGSSHTEADPTEDLTRRQSVGGAPGRRSGGSGWKMPDRDFTLVTVDSRLWRSTAEKRLWRDNQWADSTDVFDRHSPLRTILGEEQFAWLQQLVHTDSSQVICVSGINVLNTIYNQLLGPPPEGEEDFRVFENNCFDFAGWRSAPAKRLLELFGSREGIVALYGDLHHAGISRNVHNNVIEAHFGHTGNSGYLRAPKHDFARRMTDFNGEEVEVIANYHQYWNSLELTRRPQRADRRRDAQNFMEMAFDTRPQDPRIQMKIHHTLDAPENGPRGGGTLDVPLFETGRRPTSALPWVKTLPSADVILYSPDDSPIRGTRSRENGSLGLSGLVDIPPGTEITLVCRKGTAIDAQTLRTLPPDRG